MCVCVCACVCGHVCVCQWVNKATQIREALSEFRLCLLICEVGRVGLSANFTWSSAPVFILRACMGSHLGIYFDPWWCQGEVEKQKTKSCIGVCGKVCDKT